MGIIKQPLLLEKKKINRPNYFHELGYRKGDVVVLFMENQPEYVCIWLGLANIGITPALVNFNLHLEAVKHCIQVSKAKAVIFGAELTSGKCDNMILLPG